MRKEPRDKEDRTRWTSRSVGSNLQHNIFYFLIRYIKFFSTVGAIRR